MECCANYYFWVFILNSQLVFTCIFCFNRLIFMCNIYLNFKSGLFFVKPLFLCISWLQLLSAWCSSAWLRLNSDDFIGLFMALNSWFLYKRQHLVKRYSLLYYSQTYIQDPIKRVLQKFLSKIVDGFQPPPFELST